MKKIVYALSFVGLVLPGLVAAEVHPLQQLVNQLKTFSADFVQEREEEYFFRIERSTGTFDLMRPGMMRWDYQSPEQQHILVDGIRLWVHDVELNQVSVRPVAEIQNDIPLAWLLFEEPIEQAYRIVSAGNRAGLTWYNLRPRGNTFFQSIEIGIKDGVMQQVWMYQSADNVTKVRFENIQVNQPISPQAFRFSVPNNADLFGEM
ncbi:outer membrane lipoprotein carrier protein LolA [Thiomicrospira microaerophila]|uniref:LolA family protein n=1 Tax=Thiomicrospira microaerophila TaxID=406020 RepID=UPI002010B6E0|nr:outer membrane lipoprotein carrier protein LolA [Thiomicrospira microaerophila]UQB43225.1 outer membrane lipoprotein carrier protein LolA [Thiomicrospira microaerophila]